MAQTSVKEAIEEMKAVVMELYRSAGNLDSIVRDIENGLNGETVDPEYLNMTALYLYKFRTDYKLSKQTSKREEDAWTHLLKATRKKES